MTVVCFEMDNSFLKSYIFLRGLKQNCDTTLKLNSGSEPDSQPKWNSIN